MQTHARAPVLNGGALHSPMTTVQLTDFLENSSQSIANLILVPMSCVVVGSLIYFSLIPARLNTHPYDALATAAYFKMLKSVDHKCNVHYVRWNT